MINRNFLYRSKLSITFKIKKYDIFNMMNQFEGIPIPRIDDELFPEEFHPDTPTISCHRLAEIIENPSSYDQIIILDARFQYEFNGGHIIGARNIINSNQIADIYNNCSGKKTCLICYCEFSQGRSPTLFKMIRSYDRNQHINDYPNLTIPNLYVLESGYRSFYDNYPSLCVGGYINMRDPQYIQNGTLKRCFSFYRKNMTQNSLIQPNQYNLRQPHIFFNNNNNE